MDRLQIVLNRLMKSANNGNLGAREKMRTWFGDDGDYVYGQDDGSNLGDEPFIN